jgi:pimeloyl-ACP methyl ester carboxylesterase
MSSTSSGPVYRSVGGLLPSNAPAARLRAAAAAGDDYGASSSPDWREVDWSEHVHDTTVLGRRMRYMDYGSGPETPIVFIHGWMSNWQCWLENIRATAETGRRVIAVDLPGSGFSEMPAEQISIAGYARTVARLCDQLGVDRMIPVGNSMGGFVSAELAISSPDLVERLVLVSAAGISTATMREGPAAVVGRVLQFGMLRQAKHSRRDPMLIRPKLRHSVVGFVFRHPTRLRTDFLYEMMGGVGKEGFYPQMLANMTYDFRERVPQIGCPTLVVWGRQDRLVPVADGIEYERMIPDARLLIMEDTGHLPMAERPVAFNDAVAEFVAEVGTADAKADAVA